MNNGCSSPPGEIDILESASTDTTGRRDRIRLFMALSRTPHGLLDLATPGLAALLWLGAFPPASVLILGLLTAFAGYTAVYAINDLVDYRSDREKYAQGALGAMRGDLDSVYVRHPLAQGRLRVAEAIWWTALWSAVALLGALLLNPACALIFLAASGLEILYCLLLRVSHFRALLSGMVKSSGGIAAVLAVDPNPSFRFLALLFLWLFAWEIGGQNIPNDWADMEEDRRLEAKTVPARLGAGGSAAIIVASLAVAVASSVWIARAAPARPGRAYLALGIIAGIYLLIIPALRLLVTRDRQHAASLFNRASCYPLAMLGAVLLGWILG